MLLLSDTRAPHGVMQLQSEESVHKASTVCTPVLEGQPPEDPLLQVRRQLQEPKFGPAAMCTGPGHGCRRLRASSSLKARPLEGQRVAEAGLQAACGLCGIGGRVAHC